MTLSHPWVSVITPAYNCEKFLGATMYSVMSQSYPFIEYAVIDDGSTDGTKGVAEEEADFCETSITYLHHANVGEQKTVNRGLEWVKTTGAKYFMVVNADDPLLPCCVAKLVEFMEEHPDVLCAYPYWHCISEDNRVLWEHKPLAYDFSYMVRHHTCLPSVGSLFRASVIDSVGFRDPSFKWVGDFDYWLRIGLQGPMALYPETLASWRMRDGQASGDKSDARALEHIRVIQKMYASIKPDDILWDIHDEAQCWMYLVAAAVSKTKWAPYTWEAVKAYPYLFTSIEFWDGARRRLANLAKRAIRR